MSDRTLLVLAATAVGVAVTTASFHLLRWLLLALSTGPSGAFAVAAGLSILVSIVLGLRAGELVYRRIERTEGEDSPLDEDAT